MKIFKVIVAFLLLLSASSCSKEGAEGPLGRQGEQGVQGTQGIPGTDGNMIIHGTGAPENTDGEPGDFYIDMGSSKLYGPKEGDHWGASTSLKGAKGEAGTKGATGASGSTGATGATGAKGQDGSQFLSGTAVPTAQGKAGDFYFRTSTATLYGPKTSSGWGTGISLKGAKGDKGDAGVKGDAGDKGDTGDKGETGNKGAKGDKGDPGNANVKTFTKSIGDLEWTVVGSASSGYDRLEILAPEVLTTQAIQNSVILVYVKSTDYGDNWALLPYYTERKIRVEAEVSTGKLLLKKNQNDTPGTQSHFSSVKIVIIESSPAGELMRNVNDFKNYNTVKSVYGLKD